MYSQKCRLVFGFWIIEASEHLFAICKKISPFVVKFDFACSAFVLILVTNTHHSNSLATTSTYETPFGLSPGVFNGLVIAEAPESSPLIHVKYINFAILIVSRTVSALSMCVDLPV